MGQVWGRKSKPHLPSLQDTAVTRELNNPLHTWEWQWPLEIRACVTGTGTAWSLHTAAVSRSSGYLADTFKAVVREHSWILEEADLPFLPFPYTLSEQSSTSNLRFHAILLSPEALVVRRKRWCFQQRTRRDVSWKALFPIVFAWWSGPATVLLKSFLSSKGISRKDYLGKAEGHPHSCCPAVHTPGLWWSPCHCVINNRNSQYKGYLICISNSPGSEAPAKSQRNLHVQSGQQHTLQEDSSHTAEFYSHLGSWKKQPGCTL